MSLGRQIGLKGLTYQGGGSMLSWRINRYAGLGILLFVGLHVIASFMTQQGFASDAGIAINTIYESWPFQIFIIFCVLFHTFHGLRVTVLDFWPQFLRFQREALWLQWFVFIPVYGLTIFILVTRALSGE